MPPVLAGDWLVFGNGETVTSQIWSGQSPPVPGVNVASDATVVPWVQESGDNHPDHYTLDNGSLTHTPPAPPAPVVVPDVDAFKTHVVQDFMTGALPSQAYIDLCKFSSTVSNLASQPTALQASWSALKAEDAQPGGPLSGNYSSGVHSGEAITDVIEGYATTHNVPLVP